MSSTRKDIDFYTNLPGRNFFYFIRDPNMPRKIFLPVALPGLRARLFINASDVLCLLLRPLSELT